MISSFQTPLQKHVFYAFNILTKMTNMTQIPILWILVAGYGDNLQKAFGRDDDHKSPRYLKTHDYHRLG